MSMTVQEIEKAIKELTPNDVSKLAEWFEEFEAQLWDAQIKEDLENGKLRELISEAERDFVSKNIDKL
jgi:hypothetical protein